MMPVHPEWLRPEILKSNPARVDREKKVIYGYLVAESGVFKDKRGEFDKEAIQKIVDLYAEHSDGLKSRFTHPSLSDDGLGKFLGRSKNATMNEVGQGSGKPKVYQARADLHLDSSSFNTPNGDLGTYIMNLAESDPRAFGSSLVLKVDQKYRIDEKGLRVKGKDGADLPPLWYPTRLHASDVVDDGDAVHSGFLSTEGLPDEVQRLGWEYLDRIFASQPRNVCEERVKAYLSRYLNDRYGPAGPDAATLRRKIRQREQESL